MDLAPGCSGPPVPSRWLEPTSGQLRGSGRDGQLGWGGDPVFHDNAEAARTKTPQSAFYWFELIICGGGGGRGPAIPGGRGGGGVRVGVWGLRPERRGR